VRGDGECAATECSGTTDNCAFTYECDVALNCDTVNFTREYPTDLVRCAAPPA
jgi:hypothetical protein